MENKNTGLKVLVIILCLLVVGLSGYIVYDKVLSDEKEPNQGTNDNNDKKILYIVTDEKSVEKKYLTEDYNGIDNKNNIIAEYKCYSDNCYANYPYIPSPNYSFVGENSVLITVKEDEKNKVIKYNYITKKVEDTYDSANSSYDLEEGNYTINVSKMVDEKYKSALLGKNGKMLTGFEYDSLPAGKMSQYGSDSKNSDWYGPNSLARVGKDNLYGIIDVSNGKVIVDLKYQDIILSPNGYYSIKENNKWYLYDNNLNKVLNKGYDGIFAYNFGILVLSKSENDKIEIKLINYNGSDKTNTIEIKNNFFADYYTGDLSYRELLYIVENNNITFSSGGVDDLTFNYDKQNNKLSIVE